MDYSTLFKTTFKTTTAVCLSLCFASSAFATTYTIDDTYNAANTYWGGNDNGYGDVISATN